jgi:hypothetical protein
MLSNVKEVHVSIVPDLNNRTKRCRSISNYHNLILCKLDGCNMENTISKYSDEQGPDDVCALVITTICDTYTDTDTTRHERCHSICIQFDSNTTGMKYHAAAIHSTGRLYALYELKEIDNNDEKEWVKIKTNV